MDFEPRFQEPSGWRWGHFQSASGLSIRYGTVSPEKPKAMVVILPGRSEYCEKYFETTHDLLAQNFSVCVIDWAGQGKSGRFNVPYPERGHAQNFGTYADDLHNLLTQHLKTELPLVMLAHSMGGNIGLRYLLKYRNVFTCAAFSAPMIGIAPLRKISFKIALPVLWFLQKSKAFRYVKGEKDWTASNRNESPHLSKDPVRGLVHNAWMNQDPDLRLGGVTYGWLFKAMASCALLQKPGAAYFVRTPSLIVVGGQETLTDNHASKAFAEGMPHCAFHEIPAAAHEILMEIDDIRQEFLTYFYSLIAQNIVQ